MSSTSQDEKERLARDFYARNLLPLSRPGRAATYFPMGPDPALASYYTRRAKSRWTAADFTAQSVDKPADLGAALAALWQQAGNPELAALAGGLGTLAAAMYDVDSQTDSITPFMYVMF